MRGRMVSNSNCSALCGGLFMVSIKSSISVWRLNHAHMVETIKSFVLINRPKKYLWCWYYPLFEHPSLVEVPPLYFHYQLFASGNFIFKMVFMTHRIFLRFSSLQTS